METQITRLPSINLVRARVLGRRYSRTAAKAVTFETAHSLEEAFVYATEVNLATLCQLCMTKKSAKSKIARQRAICMGMLTTCRRQWVTRGHVNWGESRRNFPRVQELIANREPEDILDALDQLIDGWSGQDPLSTHPAATT